MFKDLIANCEEDVQMLQENLEYYQNRYELLEAPITGDEVQTRHRESYNITGAGFKSSPDFVRAKATLDSPSPTKGNAEESKLGALATLLLESQRNISKGFETRTDKVFVRLGFDETPWYILFQI